MRVTDWSAPEVDSVTAAGQPPVIGALPAAQVKRDGDRAAYQPAAVRVLLEVGVAAMVGLTTTAPPVQSMVPARSAWLLVLLSSAQKTGLMPPTHSEAAARP